MTAQPAHEDATTSAPRCWCCGAERRDDELVHLGNHPEVAVCVGCARWLHRRATQLQDSQHSTIATRWRAVVRSVRAHVIDKGWHRRGILGALLRRIDRYLP